MYNCFFLTSNFMLHQSINLLSDIYVSREATQETIVINDVRNIIVFRSLLVIFAALCATCSCADFFSGKGEFHEVNFRANGPHDSRGDFATICTSLSFRLSYSLTIRAAIFSLGDLSRARYLARIFSSFFTRHLFFRARDDDSPYVTGDLLLC